MMLRRLLLSLVISAGSLLCQPSQGSEVVGLVSGGTYHLMMNEFGVELWEAGKRADWRGRLQQWRLSCTGLPTKRTHCSLTRLVIDEYDDTEGRVIGQHEHSTADGTLKVVRDDWRQGRVPRSRR